MVSILLQVLAAISALDFLQPYLLTSQFNAWQGLLRDPPDWAPVVRAAWVSALYGVPSLLAAMTVFLRRDVTGGMVTRSTPTAADTRRNRDGRVRRSRAPWSA